MLTFDQDDLTGLMALIKQKYPTYTLGYDKSNVLGVKIPDLTGGAYRYREGARSESSFRELTVHDDFTAAKDEFQNTQALREAKARQRILGGGDISLDRSIDVDGGMEDSAAASEVPSVPESLAYSRLGSAAAANENSSRSQVSRPSGPWPSRPQLQLSSSSQRASSASAPRPSRSQLLRSWPVTPFTTARSGASSAASACRPSPEKSGNVVDEADIEEDEEDETQEQQDEDDGQRRRAKKDRLVADGTLALSKAQHDWTPERHASKFKGAKAVQRVVLNLRKWGRSNGAYDSDQNQQLSAQLFNFADVIEDRQAFLDKCSSDFESVVLDPLAAKYKGAASSFPPAIVCNLVVKGCQSLADKALTGCPKAAKAILASISTQPELVLQVPESDVKGFGIATAIQELRRDRNLADDEKKGIIDVIISSQNAAMLGHLEKIYKMPDMDKFMTAANNITCHLEKVDDSSLASVFQKLTPSATDSASTDQGQPEQSITDDFWHGFNPQLHLDIIATRLMVLVGRVGTNKPSRSLMSLAGVVCSLSTKVSPRLRCYHSGIGFKSNPVKTLWKLIEGLEHRAAAQPKSISADATKSFTVRFAKAAALGEETLLVSVLAEAVEGDSTEELKTFLSHADEADDPETKQVLAGVVTAMLTALEALAKSQNMFSDVLRDYIQGSKESELRSLPDARVGNSGMILTTTLTKSLAWFA